MSTKTLRKRIALVAVSALGFGLVSVVPASAAATAVEQKTGSTTVVRSDIASSTAVITVSTTAAGTLAAGDLTLGSFTKGGLSLGSQVPAGVSWDWADGATDVDGSGTGEASASDGIVDVTSAIAATATDLVVVTIANTTAVGKYTFAVDSGASDTDAVIFTFYVSGAPAALAFDKTAYVTEATVNASAQLSIKDSAGQPSFYKAGDSLTITSSSSSATTSVVLVDSGNYGQAVANTGYISTNLASSTGGSYTFTATGIGGSATATLTVDSAPATVESVALATGTLAIGHETGTTSTVRTTAANDSSTNATTSIFLHTSQTSVTFNLTDTGETTAKNFKIAVTQTSSVPFPGGVAASGTVYKLATLDADGTGSTTTYTVTSTSALAGTGYTVTIEGGTNDIVYKVLYQASQPYDIDLVDPLATTIAAVELGTSTQAVIVKDQFGVAVANTPVSYTTSSRNTVAVKSVNTDSAGKASISTTDAALTTATADDTFTATIPTISIAGATFDGDAVTTIKYYDLASDIAAATGSLAVTQPATPGTTATYDTTITTATAPAVTVDTTLDNSASNQVKIADQIKVVSTFLNAAATGIVGIPVSVTGTNGVYFKSGAGPSEVLVGSQTGAATTLAGYTTTGGAYTFEAAFTKSGTATITVTAGSVSKTYSITVNAGARGIISATASTSGIVTASVTDLWGNPVSGATVTFTAASGAQLGGNFSSLSSNTGTDGKTSVQASTSVAGDYVVTTAISGGDSAVAADTTNGVPAGKASTTATVTIAPVKSAEVLAVEAAAAAAEATAKANAEATAAAVKAAADAAAAQAAADKAATDAAIAALKAQLEAAAATAAADKAAAEAAAKAAAEAAAVKAAADKEATEAAIAAAQAAAKKAGEDAVAAAAAAQAAAVEAAQAATDAATEALDAANAATDAANASAEAGDAATAAAQDAADAVAALSTQVSEMITALKKQITALTNLVIKIQKKVKA